ncbi:MAG: thioredoxin domain-containing protein [bacterium]
MLKKFFSIISNNKLLCFCFLFLGLFIGALAVDFSGVGKGTVSLDYLQSNSAKMFQTGDKTWISYDNPIVEVIALNDFKCSYCDDSEYKEFIEQNITPTVEIKDLDVNSQEGKTFIKTFNIKAIPAYIFSEEIKNIKDFSKISDIFKQEGEFLILESYKTGALTPLKVLDNPLKSSDAKITIVEISDYECPYCKKAAGALKDALKDYPESEVKLIHKHLPLDFHNFALDASVAAECARRQEKFSQMNDILFGSQFDSEDDIKNFAKNIPGLNYLQFEECFDYRATEAIVEFDKNWAMDFNIYATPTFLVNERYIGGAISAEEFKKIIEEEL